ncbi:hypothetical protein CIG11343_1252 [Campylobacter iguaniorum]|uniref:hypothetical protein n=1 Tax=Campylobacter iguaniorum TaxID=1244531 RepID=UPI0007C8B587|nr:hypothetical protein [Campylobacter iguaniorum]ANE36265.1 hypothetical protein CIG11343_1252 [Campylobacter iguaniorum]
MKKDGQIYCNICLASDKEEPNIVFIQAIHKGQNIDICTSCMPTVIHGSGSSIKSNEEVQNKIK